MATYVITQGIQGPEGAQGPTGPQGPAGEGGGGSDGIGAAYNRAWEEWEDPGYPNEWSPLIAWPKDSIVRDGNKLYAAREDVEANEMPEVVQTFAGSGTIDSVSLDLSDWQEGDQLLFVLVCDGWPIPDGDISGLSEGPWQGIAITNDTYSMYWNSETEVPSGEIVLRTNGADEIAWAAWHIRGGIRNYNYYNSLDSQYEDDPSYAWIRRQPHGPNVTPLVVFTKGGSGPVDNIFEDSPVTSGDMSDTWQSHAGFILDEYGDYEGTESFWMGNDPADKIVTFYAPIKAGEFNSSQWNALADAPNDFFDLNNVNVEPDDDYRVLVIEDGEVDSRTPDWVRASDELDDMYSSFYSRHGREFLHIKEDGMDLYRYDSDQSDWLLVQGFSAGGGDFQTVGLDVIVEGFPVEVTGVPRTLMIPTNEEDAGITLPSAESQDLGRRWHIYAPLTGVTVSGLADPDFLIPSQHVTVFVGIPLGGGDVGWSVAETLPINGGLVLGETSSTAYRGDRGKIAYDHSQTSGNPHGTTRAQIGAAAIVNTDGDPGTTIYVGSIDPDVDYTPEDGDLWFPPEV